MALRPRMLCLLLLLLGNARAQNLSYAIAFLNSNAITDDFFDVWFAADGANFEYIGFSEETNFTCSAANCRGGMFVPSALGLNGCPPLTGLSLTSSINVASVSGPSVMQGSTTSQVGSNQCGTKVMDTIFCKTSTLLDLRPMPNPQVRVSSRVSCNCQNRFDVVLYSVVNGQVTNQIMGAYGFGWSVPSTTPTPSVTPAWVIGFNPPTALVSASATVSFGASQSATASISKTPSPTASFSTTPTPTASFSTTPTATSTQSVTASASATASVSSSQVVPSSSPSISSTSSVSASFIPSPTASVTPSATASRSASSSYVPPSASPTPSTSQLPPSRTSTSSLTATSSSTSTSTSSSSSTATSSSTSSATSTRSLTATSTSSSTSTSTQTVTATSTSSSTSTSSRTVTSTSSSTSTSTSSSSSPATSSSTASSTSTSSSTASATSTSSVTASGTSSASVTGTPSPTSSNVTLAIIGALMGTAAQPPASTSGNLALVAGVVIAAVFVVAGTSAACWFLVLPVWYRKQRPRSLTKRPRSTGKGQDDDLISVVAGGAAAESAQSGATAAAARARMLQYQSPKTIAMTAAHPRPRRGSTEALPPRHKPASESHTIATGRMEALRVADVELGESFAFANPASAIGANRRPVSLSREKQKSMRQVIALPAQPRHQGAQERRPTLRKSTGPTAFAWERMSTLSVESTATNVTQMQLPAEDSKRAAPPHAQMEGDASASRSTDPITRMMSGRALIHKSNRHLDIAGAPTLLDDTDPERDPLSRRTHGLRPGDQDSSAPNGTPKFDLEPDADGERDPGSRRTRGMPSSAEGGKQEAAPAPRRPEFYMDPPGPPKPVSRARPTRSAGPNMREQASRALPLGTGVVVAEKVRAERVQLRRVTLIRGDAAITNMRQAQASTMRLPTTVTRDVIDGATTDVDSGRDAAAGAAFGYAFTAITGRRTEETPTQKAARVWRERRATAR